MGCERFEEIPVTQDCRFANWVFSVRPFAAGVLKIGHLRPPN